MSILKSRRQYLDHSIRQSRSCCSRKPSSTFETYRLIFVSSANNNIMLLRIHRGKSFMNIKNSMVPRTEPWGTPISTTTQSESPRSSVSLGLSFLSASLYFSKRGAYEIGCVVTSLVGCHARALWQTVHPRLNTNRKPYPRNSMVQLSTPWGDP